MTQVLHPKADLVAEGATGGRAGLLFRELAVSPLTPQDLAQRISLEGSALTYPEALQIVYTWTASLPSALTGPVHTSCSASCGSSIRTRRPRRSTLQNRISSVH